MIKVNKNQRHKDAQEILDRISQSGGGTLWTPRQSNVNHYYIQPNDVGKTMMDLTGYIGFNIDNKGIINKTPISVMDVGSNINQPTKSKKISDKSIEKSRKSFSGDSELIIPLVNDFDNKSISSYKSKHHDMSSAPYHKYELISKNTNNLSNSSRSFNRNKSIIKTIYNPTNDIKSEKTIVKSKSSLDLDAVNEYFKSHPNLDKPKSINDIIDDMVFEIYSDRILNYNFINNDDIKKQQKEINQYTIDYYENMENNNILEVKNNVIIKCLDKNQSEVLVGKKLNNKSAKNKQMLICQMIDDITQFYYIRDNIAIINLVGNNCTLDKTLPDQYAESLLTIVQFLLGLPKDLNVLFNHRKVLQTYEIDDFVKKEQNRHTDEWYIVERQYNDYIHYIIDMLSSYYRVDIKLVNYNLEINNKLSSYDDPRRKDEKGNPDIIYFNNFQINILYLYDDKYPIESPSVKTLATKEQLAERDEIINKKIQLLKEHRKTLGEKFNEIHNENVLHVFNIELGVDNDNFIDYDSYNMSDFLIEFQSYKYLIKYDYNAQKLVLPTIEELENAISDKNVEKFNDYKDVYYFYPMIFVYEDDTTKDKIYYQTLYDSPRPDDEE